MINDFGTLLLKITPQRIGFIKFILEGYDGMALVSTLDPKSGSIIIRYPLSFHDNLTAIIADLSPLLFGDITKSQNTMTRNGLNYEEQTSFITKLHH